VPQAIPDFVDHGLLPDGVYGCQREDIAARFVEAVPDSDTRSDIWKRFLDFNQQAEGVGMHAVQWIDGSFVSSKSDPKDIDIVNWVEAGVYNRLAPDVHTYIDNVLSGNFAYNKWRTDSRWIPVFPADHPLHGKYLEVRDYWKKQWGLTRDKPRDGDPPPGVKKGFLRTAIGDEAQTPVVAEGW